jgi:putative PIN family toxin of toxin-antitoxin system
LLKIVIDTNIYISAIFWGGKPREVIDLGRDNSVRIFTSSEIVNEISEKLRLKFKIPENEVSQILIDLSTFTFPVEVTKNYQVIHDDPDDDKFIDCAVQSDADYIVSGDRHLLNLGDYAGTKILKASEFLSIFREKVEGGIGGK